MSSFISISSSSSRWPWETASSSFTTGRPPGPLSSLLFFLSIEVTRMILLPWASSMSLRELEEYEEMFMPDLLLTLESIITLDSSLEWSSCMRLMLSFSSSIYLSLILPCSLTWLSSLWRLSRSLRQVANFSCRSASLYFKLMISCLWYCSSLFISLSFSLMMSSNSIFCLAIVSSNFLSFTSAVLFNLRSSFVKDYMLIFFSKSCSANLPIYFSLNWLFSLQYSRIPMVLDFSSSFLCSACWISLFFSFSREKSLFLRWLFSEIMFSRLTVYSSDLCWLRIIKCWFYFYF